MPSLLVTDLFLLFIDLLALMTSVTQRKKDTDCDQCCQHNTSITAVRIKICLSFPPGNADAQSTFFIFCTA